MTKIGKFEDLVAWQRARLLTRELYRVSGTDGFARGFALKDQIRRAAVSIMSNIAEGFERDGNKEFCNFLSIGKASAGEVRSQLFVALDQNYVSRDEFAILYRRAGECGRVIAGLIKYLKETRYSGNKFKKSTENSKQETRN